MTLNFLPWTIYILIALSASTVLVILVIKHINDYPKTLTWALFLFSIAGILFGVNRFVTSIPGLEQYEPLVFNLSMLFFLPAIPLLCIGCSIKVKDDPEKKKIVQIGIAGTFFCIALMIVLVLTSI